jgi:hypothetical protein
VTGPVEAVLSEREQLLERLREAYGFSQPEAVAFADMVGDRALLLEREP